MVITLISTSFLKVSTAKKIHCYFVVKLKNMSILCFVKNLKFIGSGAALVALAYLNLNRCGLSDEGCDKFSGE